ncbi:ABC transporter permease [soil metagenome]
MFALKLAWRDSRGARRRLLLYVSAMTLGVAALVAIRSFGESIEVALDSRSQEVLGADLSLRASRPFSPEQRAFADSLNEAHGGEQVREITLASMALFPSTGDTRLTQVRGIRGRHPLYGTMVTVPADAALTYQEEGAALIDAPLLDQYGITVGDSVRIGERTFRIAGRVESSTGQPELAALVGPRVYVPLDSLDAGLLATGTRATNTAFFRFANVNPDSLVFQIEPRLEELSLRAETAATSGGEWNEALGQMTQFLVLVGFVALLLGGIGVASAVSLHLRRRADSVATLRCIGARSGTLLGAYTLQASVLGVAAAILGAALGLGVQLLLPLVLAGLLPVDVPAVISVSALIEGLLLGVGVAIAFALLPLLGVRQVPPLKAIRADAEGTAGARDPYRWLVALALLGGVFLFAYYQTDSTVIAGAFVGATAGVFVLLVAVARLVRALARRLVPRSGAYVIRQGIANLYRPGNQTLVLMLTLGLGTFLTMTLAVGQQSVLVGLSAPVTGAEDRPNIVLFDIQSDQREGVASLVEGAGFPVIQQVPIVSMRIRAVDGVETEVLRADTTLSRRAPWAITREYRSTYRSEMVEGETLIEGAFVGTFEGEPGPENPVPVSLEVSIAEELGLDIGDRITFGVSGVGIDAFVASTRRVEWARLQPNFFIVFPEGVLEEAPQFGVMLSRTPDAATSGRLQRILVEEYPNVSAVDLQGVLAIVERILAEVAFVLRFMALFALGTGLIVLAGAVRAAHEQRADESVLLRTLGASRQQVRRIVAAEYAFVGFLATLSGSILAIGGGWLLARLVLNVPLAIPWLWLTGALIFVPLMTVGIGLIGSRGVFSRPPLEVLRAEG